ncbi:MAG: hypothetical protein GY716_25735 [bacterium]|nr:hypothetical protein [bacterium]
MLGLTAIAQVVAIWLYTMGWTLAAIVLDAGVMLRAFIIYHDGIHRSFFSNRKGNALLARWMQIWIVTPVGLWRRNHLDHHASFGNLDVPDPADTIMFTRKQFESWGKGKRLLIRVLRQPILFFVLAPVAQWWIQYPVRYGNPILFLGHAVHLLVAWQFGWWHMLALYLGALSGLILFHLQHAVDRGYREHDEGWNYYHGALLGSTYVRVPWPLSWFTLGIEYHHIHHVNTRVPSYRLARCHRDAPAGMWRAVTVPTLRECVAAMFNTMWDEDSRHFRRF